MIRSLFGLILIFSLVGCGTLKPIQPDPKTGLFPTTTEVAPSDIQIAEPFKPAYLKMAYVNVDVPNPNMAFVNYFMTSLKNMGIFEKVLNKDDLQAIIIQNQLQDKVTNVSDLIGLNALSKQIGDFIIIKPNAQWKQGYDYEGAMTVIDAGTGKTVFKSDITAFNFSGLDMPLYRPLLNSFVLWTQNKLPPGSAASNH